MLKHKVMCTIMKASEGEGRLCPHQSTSPVWLVTVIIPLMEPAAGGVMGMGQAMWSTSPYWPSWSLSRGPCPLMFKMTHPKSHNQ